MHDKIVALGLDSETTNKIEEVLKEVIKDSYVPLSRFNEVNDAKNKLTQTVADRDKQLEELSKSTGMTDELKKQLDELQAANIKAKQDYIAEIKRMKTESYINDTLMENGVIDTKFIPAVRAYLPTVDIDSDDSKYTFVAKINDVKTFLPAMFKNNDPNKTMKGYNPNSGNGDQSKIADPKGSWDDYLKSFESYQQ